MDKPFDKELRREYFRRIIKKIKPVTERECLMFNKCIYGDRPEWEVFKNQYKLKDQRKKYNDYIRKDKELLRIKLRQYNKEMYLDDIKSMKESELKKMIVLLEYVIDNKEDIKKNVDKFVDVIIQIINKK